MFFSKAIVTAILATSSAWAAPLAARSQEYFTPSAIWAYDVGTSAIESTDPDIASGLKCQFAFSIASGDTLDGSGKLDLFSSLSHAPGNQRNIHLGRLSAASGADATWDANYSTYLTEKTDCKEPGTVEAFELVGVYDDDLISWADGASGPRIVLSN